MPHVVRRCLFTLFAAGVAACAFAADVREVKVEDLTLSVPETWESQPPSNRLRLAQFVIPPASGTTEPTELVVSYFGGGAGGADANIDRWIGQFETAGRQVKVTKGNSKQGPYYLVDIRGTYNMPVGPPIKRETKALPDAEMLGVILEVKGQGNYFLKMAGPTKSVAPQADALRASFGGDAGAETPYELK